MRLAVAGKVSDHYLCAWGEVSSSMRAIHPGDSRAAALSNPGD
jgi:hypothetical protein